MMIFSLLTCPYDLLDKEIREEKMRLIQLTARGAGCGHVAPQGQWVAP
jgi:hypothetical protein